MRAGDGRVDADIPRDQPGSVGVGLQPGQDRCPDPSPLPTAKQPVNRLPRPIDRRDVSPRRACSHSPANPIDELPFGPLRWAAQLLPNRQQRFQHRPLRVGQVEPPRHRYGGHEVSGVLIVLVDDRSTGDLDYLINDTPTRRSSTACWQVRTSTQDLVVVHMRAVATAGRTSAMSWSWTCAAWCVTKSRSGMSSAPYRLSYRARRWGEAARDSRPPTGLVLVRR